jgi:transcriptional regulator with XRE-family HTH domain
MARGELAALKTKIGARIRARRKVLQISQEDLAFRAEISPTYLSQTEAGKRNISLEVLHRLAHELDLELAELVKV